MPQRDLYIDRLRSVMTALVIFHHTAITYGAPGGWFWREVQPSGELSGKLLMLFVTTNQAYFMGFFFLLAGYFTPASLERKGYGQFIEDRLLRLGLPLLAFGFLLGPLTEGIISAAQGDGFWPKIMSLWNTHEFINGPLWFAQALLIFSLIYCAWRAGLGPPLKSSEREPGPVPTRGWWALSALAVGAASLAIRQFVPVGENVFGLQLGYFAGYIFLFGLGIAAWRHDWIRQLNWRNARPGIRALLICWPIMLLAIVTLAHAAGTPAESRAASASSSAGGFSAPAIFYAFWEPFVAWGLIAVWLLVSREYMNQPSSFWTWLNRRAYAVYIIHPLILVGICLALHGWVAPALIKFAVAGVLTCAVTWLVADPLVRLTGLKRIV